MARITRLLVALSLVAVLAACGGGGTDEAAVEATTAEAPPATTAEETATGAAEESTETTEEAATEDVIPVRVSMAGFGSQAFPIETMKLRGLPEKYGFTLEEVPFTGPPTNYLQLSGDLSDLAPATWLELQQNEARGLKTVGVFPFLAYSNPMVVAADSDIQEIPDLKGKNIGVYFLGGTDVQAARAAIKELYGFDYFKEAKVTQADAVLLGKQLERGDVDAILTFSNLGSALESEGKGRELFKVSDVLAEAFDTPADAPFGIYATTPQVLSEYPERIERFAAAYKEAIDIMQTDDAIWTELAATQGIEDPAAVDALRETERAGFSLNWDEEAIDTMEEMFGIIYNLAGTEVTGIEEFDRTAYNTEIWAQATGS